jgi:hypothetical protein
MFEDWMKLGVSALLLGFEAQQVAALRMWRIATSGDHGRETQLMVSEKIDTFVDAGRAAAVSAARGETIHSIAEGVIGTYRKRVRRNARRLRK